MQHTPPPLVRTHLALDFDDDVGAVIHGAISREAAARTAGICSPLDIIQFVAAPRGGFQFHRRTRAEMQQMKREARRARRLHRRALRTLSATLYALWLRPKRWRDAWTAHHEKWAYAHGWDGYC